MRIIKIELVVCHVITAIIAVTTRSAIASRQGYDFCNESLMMAAKMSETYNLSTPAFFKQERVAGAPLALSWPP